MTRELMLAGLLSVMGCTTITRIVGGDDGSEGSTEELSAGVVEVPRSLLPPEAAFLDLGSVGRVYQLTHPGPVDAGFPVPPDIGEALLVDTLRLFVWDGQSTWTEVPDSGFDPAASEVVAAGLNPGFYTAFGWCADPVQNTMQRLILDAQRGYRPGGQPVSYDELEAEFGGLNHPAYGAGMLRDWLQLSFSVTRTTCETYDGPGCDPVCGRPLPYKLSSCPTECPETTCCDCETFSETERAYIPAGLLDGLLRPCPTGGLCPVCPDGLSCPTGVGPALDTIAPWGGPFDYQVLDELRVGVLTGDDWVRGGVEALIQQTLGLAIDEERLP